MPKARIDQLKVLEGRQVSLALRDGSRIDDCQLVSAGRIGVRSVWIFTRGIDKGIYLPIRHGVSVFAMRKDLDIPPDPWDVPRFRLARFR